MNDKQVRPLAAALTIGLSIVALSALAWAQQPSQPSPQQQPPTLRIPPPAQPPETPAQQPPQQAQQPQAEQPQPKPQPALPPLPQRYTTFAIDTMSDRPGQGALMLDIVIKRWSTPTEREELFSGLREKGMPEFVRLLHNQPSAGYIRASMSVGYDLRYATEDPTPKGGWKLLLLMDRPMYFGELWSGSRTVDYPLTVIEIQVNAKGEGSGTMSVASKMIAAGQVLVIENYDIQPVRLNSVKLEK